ncbi:MAG: c-type cytochrome [Chitinophagaceae bacterium]|nr:c-type cytochrome [Chitinophagaceae bacterium]
MRKSLLTILCLSLPVITLTYLLGSCQKEQPVNGLTLLEQEIPAGFPNPVYRFEGNHLTQEGFELGRKLFYDGRLSIDNVHPCSSCHEQAAAFGTFEHDRSHGVNNTHTLRNAPVLFNLAWRNSFHWDGEFTSLYDEAAHPIHGANEMGETYEGIINKIKEDADYQERFKKVFRSSIIRPEYILKALQQYTGYMVSANSRYDKYKRGEVSFTLQEDRGYTIYKNSCATCHPEPLFTDNSYRNIGLPVDNFLKDYGRMRITGNAADSLKFRVPTLRNTNISSNYMHDGRFNTLYQCMTHYRTGVQPGPTVDPLLSGGIPLTDAQVNDVVAFLKTLTDSAFIKDSRFSRPR